MAAAARGFGSARRQHRQRQRGRRQQLRGFCHRRLQQLGAGRSAELPRTDFNVPSQITVSPASPATVWTNDEAYGMSTYGMWLGFIAGDDQLPSEPTAMFQNMVLWNILNAGVVAYHTANVTFDHLLIIGDPYADDRNDVPTFGLDLRRYENFNFVVQNSTIEGERIGVATPNNDSSQAGALKPTIIQNTTLDNYINVLVSPAEDDRPGNGNAVR